MSDGLTTDGASAIALELSGLSQVGDCLSFDFEIHNGSGLTLSSSEKHPVMLAWFIVGRDDAGPWIGDFQRIPLSDTIAAGQIKRQHCQISIGDADRGRDLIVTLVVEGRFWFHLDPVGRYARAEIQNQDDPWWDTRQARSIAFSNVEKLNKKRFKPFFEQNGRGRPLFLHLETVNICNLKCLICPYISMQRDKETMSSALFQSVINDYIDMGGGDVGLTPSVGDVFLDKQLVERVRVLRSRPEIRSIGFVTNAGNAGVLSNNDLSYVINQCARINISVYGLDEEENAAMTRRVGKFEQIQHQIKRIVELNHSAIVVFAFRLLKENAERRAAEWMTSMFGKMYPHEVLTTYGNWGGAIDIAEPLPFQGNWLNPDGENHRTLKPCAYPALHLKVAVNGDVKFCSCIDYDSLPENIIGNVKQQHLSDIYNGLKAKQLWLDGLSICAGCTHYKPVEVFNTHDNLLGEPIKRLGI